MPRYIVSLSVEISASITIEADNKKDAEDNWHKKQYAMQAAINDVISEARMLDDYEFDVRDVTPVEDEDEERVERADE